MTLEEWQELVRLHGEFAYLMIKVNYQKEWVVPVNNSVVQLYLNNSRYEDIMIQQSAALPFDLAAALAGDAVEILTCNEWLDCSNDYALYLYNNEGHDNKNSKTHLRMKRPRLVDVDYSQFEG